MKNKKMNKMKKALKNANVKSNTLTEMADDLKDLVSKAKKKVMDKMDK